MRATDRIVIPAPRAPFLFWLILGWAFLKGVCRLTWWFARRPTLTLPLLLLAVAVYVTARYGYLAPALTALSVGAGAAGWAWQRPGSFGRLVAAPWRGWWRRWLYYAPLWNFWMGRTRLVVTDERTGRTVRPILRRVRCTPALDRLLVELPAGFAPDDLLDRADALAHATRAREARVREDRPGRVWLELVKRDPLADPIDALPIPATASVDDLIAVEIGRREDGLPWLLRLLGTHVLVAGVTGSGKGSIIWSVLRALAASIRAGLVQVWALDPKGGLELEFGAAMFARYERDGFPAMVDLLEDAADAMDARCRATRGTAREFTPTTATPFVLVLIDELATLTSYLPDRKLTHRVDDALGLLLTKGRAAGYSVLGCVQSPDKETVPYRNLFPTKVALRLDEAIQVDMVLGENVREAGAYADRIPERLPGVGYVKQDGSRDPARVRAAYVTDHQIRAMAHDHPAPGHHGARTDYDLTTGPTTGPGTEGGPR